MLAYLPAELAELRAEALSLELRELGEERQLLAGVEVATVIAGKEPIGTFGDLPRQALLVVIERDAFQADDEGLLGLDQGEPEFLSEHT